MRLIAVSFILLFFNSCGVILNDIDFLSRDYNSVVLNKETTKEIGVPLITKGKEFYQDAYFFKSEPSFTINAKPFPYKINDVLPLASETKDWYLFYDVNKSDDFRHIGIAENKQTKEVSAFIYGSMGLYIKNIPDLNVQKTIYTTKECNGCFIQEFIFNGKGVIVVPLTYCIYLTKVSPMNPLSKEQIKEVSQWLKSSFKS